MWIRVVDDAGGVQQSGAARAAEDGAGESWLRFGDQTVFYSAEDRTPAARDASDPPARTAWRHAPGTPGALHVVVQHGRRFQQHYPDVPVLHDRGRFLLVQLDPAKAGRMTDEPECCFRIFPAAPEMVVFAARARRARPSDPSVTAVTDKVAVEPARTTLERLAALHTRHSTSTGFAAAVAFARGELTARGYTVTTPTVTVGPRRSQNVIADKAGSGPAPRGVVIVTAHLDSINAAGGPGAIAPGADDNASGSTGVLEMARALQGHETRHDLRFILFGGEEQGLFGSRQYVAGLSTAERGRVAAVVNMDMIGSVNRGIRTVLLEGAAVSQSAIDALAAAAATYTSLTVETSLLPANSDHVPFIDARIPAVLTIEGADSTNDRVHSADDTIDTINYDLLVDILRMNLAFVVGAAR